MQQSDRNGTHVFRKSERAENIVDLGDRFRASWCAPMRQVESYWTALRGGRVVPLRSEVDPRGIEGALSFAFVAELLAPGHARMRIAGTHLCDIMGMEVRGMPVSAMFTPVSRDQLSRVLGEVFNAPARVDLDLIAERRIGKPELKARMLLLPMADDFGDISRVLGCLVSDGQIGRAPRRFEIARADISPLRAETEQVVSRYTRPKPSPRAAAAEEPRTFLRASTVPYLRVVESSAE